MRIEAPQHLRRGQARHGMFPAGRDLGDRLEHKNACGDAGMWKNRAARPSPDQAVVVDQIEIERARSPSPGEPRASACHALQALEYSYDSSRCCICPEYGDLVDEIGLADASYRRGNELARNCYGRPELTLKL